VSRYFEVLATSAVDLGCCINGKARELSVSGILLTKNF
jgi:hypothetical protein